MPRLRILAGALALAFAGSAAAAQFDNVIVFGDSLSDNGNLSFALGLPFAPSRFTTNPGLVAIEQVSDFYGITLTPSITGGTDFAFGGAGVDNNSSAGPIPTIPQQVQMYLGATGGKADPNTLYSMWGGGNDVLYNLGAAGAGAITPAQAQADIQTAAQTELGVIAQLGAAGAKRVIVFNLPDIGQIPEFLMQGAAVSAQGTGASLLYNSTLNAGLAKTGVDIIPIDTFALLHEIIADPARYEFTNVTTPACSNTAPSLGSLGCGPQGSPYPNQYAPGTDQTYLFADGVHPTTGTHAILGQYIVSVIQAPGQTSLLAEAPLQVSDSIMRGLRNQALAGFGNTPGNGAREFAFFDFSHQRFDATANTPQATDNFNTLSLGTDVRVSDRLSVGTAASFSHDDSNLGGNGSFKLEELMTSAYAMLNWQQGGYLGAIGSVGSLHFHNIDRNIALGPAIRHESGSTTGSHVAFTLTGGWLFGSEAWRTGPYADLGYQRIRVSGYGEDANDSTAMTFDRQGREALIGTLGWQLIGNWQTGSTMLHPYAQIAYNHDGKADPRDVRAGLVDMPGTFAMPGFMPDKTWGSAGVGVSADFTPKLSGWVSYDGRFSDRNQRVDSLNLGAKLAF
ncbi:MAG: autotransporter domain-containing protein [Pseudomonadota bacterium]|nr:autotransporter domain-containing protein [Pseudomonadota bacterium]